MQSSERDTLYRLHSEKFASPVGFVIYQTYANHAAIHLQVHDTTTAMEHEQRILVETIVSLLPPEKNTASCTFLFGLLRTAIILDTTIACRLDLERRIGMQLDQATLDDLLIPSFSYTGDTLFDVDIVQRIVINFLQQDETDDHQVQELPRAVSPTCLSKRLSSSLYKLHVARLYLLV